MMKNSPDTSQTVSKTSDTTSTEAIASKLSLRIENIQSHKGTDCQFPLLRNHSKRSPLVLIKLIRIPESSSTKSLENCKMLPNQLTMYHENLNATGKKTKYRADNTVKRQRQGDASKITSAINSNSSLN